MARAGRRGPRLPYHECDLPGGPDPLARGARRVLSVSRCGRDGTVTLTCHALFRVRQIIISWSPAIRTSCRSTGSCRHETVVLENLSPNFFFIVSRPVAPTESDRVRVPARPHGWM